MKLIFYKWEWKSLSANQGSARISFQTTSEWDTRIQIQLCNLSYDPFGGPSKSPAALYEKREEHSLLKEHWSISYLLRYFSKNSHEFATWEMKLRPTAFQVERQVHGNTRATSLHACMPAHTFLILLQLYPIALAQNFTSLKDLFIPLYHWCWRLPIITQVSSSSNFTILCILTLWAITVFSTIFAQWSISHCISMGSHHSHGTHPPVTVTKRNYQSFIKIQHLIKTDFAMCLNFTFCITLEDWNTDLFGNYFLPSKY